MGGLCNWPPSVPFRAPPDSALPFLSWEQCRHLCIAGTSPAPPSQAPDGCAWPPPLSEPDIPQGNRTPPGSQKARIISKTNGFFQSSTSTTSHLVSNSRNREFLPSNWNSTGSFMGITWAPNHWKLQKCDVNGLMFSLHNNYNLSSSNHFDSSPHLSFIMNICFKPINIQIHNLKGKK